MRMTDQNASVLTRFTQWVNIDEPLATERSSATSFYEADGLGSISSLSSSAGALAQTYTRDSFGIQTASSGSLTNPFQYTARESDPETGLYYYRARYYDPTTGRFLSEDPVDFEAGLNFYSYARNRASTYVDPLGLAECFYRISTHTLQCASRKNSKAAPLFLGPNGVFSGVGPCRDKPKCANSPDLGPIQPNEYQMNRDTRAGHEQWYRLEPIPHRPGWAVFFHVQRGGFALHPGGRSLGCITVNKNDPQGMAQLDALLKLLREEDGMNYLLVAP